MKQMRTAFLLVVGAAMALPAVAQPRGEGDPAATTCMRGEKRTGSSFTPPPVCKTNAEWAALYKQRMDPSNIGGPVACIGPEGTVDRGGPPTCR